MVIFVNSSWIFIFNHLYHEFLYIHTSKHLIIDGIIVSNNDGSIVREWFFIDHFEIKEMREAFCKIPTLNAMLFINNYILAN